MAEAPQLAPLPGFDWTKVNWGGPDEPRTTVCSYCGDELDEVSIPLIIWNIEGWCAEFCDHCQATYWGIRGDEGPVAPRHEPEVMGDVRSCRICGCTDACACPGGCYWVAEDLCSACVEKDPASLPVDHPDAPKYWMSETTGVVATAVEAYLFNERMTPEHIAALRAYLHQWIDAPVWKGERIDWLRAAIDELTTRRAIDHWLTIAVDEGLDPL